MANSDLKNKKWKIPEKYLKSLRKKLRSYNGNKKTNGYVRLKNLVQAGHITYENLKNVKHFLKKFSSDDKNYELNGGKEFEGWVNNTLKTARNQLAQSKDTRMEAGESNTHIKSHEKNHSNAVSKVGRIPRLDKSTSVSDLSNNNVNYESRTPKKNLIITESQYFNLLMENDEDEVDKIAGLMLSRSVQNMALAMELISGLGVDYSIVAKKLHDMRGQAYVTVRILMYFSKLLQKPYNEEGIVPSKESRDRLRRLLEALQAIEPKYKIDRFTGQLDYWDAHYKN